MSFRFNDGQEERERDRRSAHCWRVSPARVATPSPPPCVISNGRCGDEGAKGAKGGARRTIPLAREDTISRAASMSCTNRRSVQLVHLQTRCAFYLQAPSSSFASSTWASCPEIPMARVAREDFERDLRLLRTASRTQYRGTSTSDHILPAHELRASCTDGPPSSRALTPFSFQAFSNPAGYL